MSHTTELVVSYVTTLRNAGLTSVLKADIFVYLHSIGVKPKDVDKGINEAMRTGALILLKNGKLTLSLIKK